MISAATCFSGIGAPETAMPEWDWRWHAEIESFPCSVMGERHPGSINLGSVLADDFLQMASAHGRIDVLVGGPPCQDFSVAGLRAGMAGDRGNLTLRFLEIAHAIRPRNLLVENVPGWLSMPDNAFGSFLGGLVGADDAIIPSERLSSGRSNAFWKWRPAGKYPILDGEGEPTGGFIEWPAVHVPHWPSQGMVAGPRSRAAWRVFDAQYFGVAQRRRRVFIVADFGNGADPAAVLFERQSVRGNSPPRREAGEGTAGTLSARTEGGGGLGTDFDLAGGLQPVAEGLGFGGGNCAGPIDVAACMKAKGQRIDFEVETFIAHALRGEGFDASEDGTGRGTPIVPVAYRTSGNCGAWETGDTADALTTGTDKTSHVLAFALRGREDGAVPEISGDMVGALRAADGGSSRDYVAHAIQAGALRENPDSGPDGVGVQEGIAYTLEARAEVQAVATKWAVRRLTPTECERLQGFPDGFTAINHRNKPAADGPRYKALGNSWAVPCGRWIMERIERNMPK